MVLAAAPPVVGFVGMPKLGEMVEPEASSGLSEVTSKSGTLVPELE